MPRFPTSVAFGCTSSISPYCITSLSTVLQNPEHLPEPLTARTRATALPTTATQASNGSFQVASDHEPS